MLGNNQYKNFWTEQEISTLSDNYKLPTKELAGILHGRTIGAIRVKRQELGFHIFEIPELPKLTEAEKGYIAGLIDADGTITLTKRKDKRWTALQPRVMIANTNEEVLKWVKDKIGNGSVLHRKSVQKKKDAHLFQIWNRYIVLQLLKTIEPYLIVKKKRCELLSEFCERSIERKQTAYEKRDWEIHKIIKLLNKRGSCEDSG